jgi:hypothetical protein
VSHLLEDARKIRLLDWLTTPEKERKPKSQNQLAAELEVTAKTLRNWRSEPAFRAAWEKQAKEIVGDPENVQKVLQMLVDGALDQNETLASRTRAAHEYLTAVDAIRPPAVDMAAASAKELTDEQLQQMIAEAARRELAERQSK